MADGIVKYPNRIKQIILYEGMKYHTITPSDIDGIIEYHDKAWFIYEIKQKNKAVDVGQKLLMNRFTNDMSKIGKYALAIVAEHKIYDTNTPVYLKDCIVRDIKINANDWRKPIRKITVRELTDICVKCIDIGDLRLISKQEGE